MKNSSLILNITQQAETYQRSIDIMLLGAYQTYQPSCFKPWHPRAIPSVLIHGNFSFSFLGVKSSFFAPSSLEITIKEKYTRKQCKIKNSFSSIMILVLYDTSLLFLVWRLRVFISRFFFISLSVKYSNKVLSNLFPGIKNHLLPITSQSPSLQARFLYALSSVQVLCTVFCFLSVVTGLK